MEELRQLCAIPSVSARHQAIDECAALVARMLERRGFAATVSETGGHPIVLAHADGAKRKPDLLFYNHYDVQPPEPLWLREGPLFVFAPRVGAALARGSRDDEGECVARLASLDALAKAGGGYPCRLTWLAEGEEEVGSPHLPEWVEKHRHELAVDGAIWEEGGIDAQGHPLITLGVRGLLYVELRVQTISRDAHSGQANLLPNAVWRLVWALASLKGVDERINISGFYDAVRHPSPVERDLLAKLPSQEENIKKEYGIDRLLLDRRGIDVVAATFDPPCNIAGIGGGYQGPGSKTAIPSRATCKVDFRLVPEQDPYDIATKLRRHLDKAGFGAAE